MTLNLFDSPSGVESWQERSGPGAVLLRGFAASEAKGFGAHYVVSSRDRDQILKAVKRVIV